MNSYIEHVCSTCQFYEPSRTKANTGDCLLDYMSEEIVSEVSANETCSYWLADTAVDED